MNNSNIGRYVTRDNETLKLFRPNVLFDIVHTSSDTEMQIIFDDPDYQGLYLVYYPGSLDASDLSNEKAQRSIHCQIVISSKILIKDLLPSTVYTFCALVQNTMVSPFQCKSNQTKTPFYRQAWIHQEHKVIYNRISCF